MSWPKATGYGLLESDWFLGWSGNDTPATGDLAGKTAIQGRKRAALYLQARGEVAERLKAAVC